MRLVFFDFDGTLTTRDTIWPLASSLCEGSAHPFAYRASILAWLLMLKLRVISNHSFKAWFVSLLLRDQPEAKIAEVTERFHEKRLEPILNSSMVRTLLDHTASGDEVYLVSSNFDFFLRPLQQRWNLQGVLATRTEVRDGRYTGSIAGRACDGEEKLARVVASFGEQQARQAVAYGDSRSDSFLLDFVKIGHWVGARRGLGVARSLPTV